MPQNPFDGFQQGLMTGATLGGRMRQNQQRREIGGLLEQKDFAGASGRAYSFGDIQTGATLSTIDQQQQARARGGQITGALATGNYDGAMSFASTPEELEAITQFRENATEQEREKAVRQATDIASVIEAVQSAPADQQLALARQYAPRFNVDPANITQDTLGQLDAYRIQAIGLKDFLTARQREEAARRPIIGPNGFVSLPPGSSMPGGIAPAPLDSLDGGDWEPVRPNQPPSAPAAGGGERSQPVSVSFRDPTEAREAIAQMVPGVAFTSGTRSPQRQRQLIAQWEAGGRRGVRPADNSFHVQARAWDLGPPPGMSTSQLAAFMRSKGFRVLDEGDHVHVSW